MSRDRDNPGMPPYMTIGVIAAVLGLIATWIWGGPL